MSRKHYKFRVYFREEPTSYYSLSAVSVKAAIRQAKATCRGLRARPRKPLHVAKVENLDVAGWSEGREHEAHRRRHGLLSPDADRI